MEIIVNYSVWNVINTSCNIRNRVRNACAGGTGEEGQAVQYYI